MPAPSPARRCRSMAGSTWCDASSVAPRRRWRSGGDGASAHDVPQMGRHRARLLRRAHAARRPAAAIHRVAASGWHRRNDDRPDPGADRIVSRSCRQPDRAVIPSCDPATARPAAWLSGYPDRPDLERRSQNAENNPMQSSWPSATFVRLMLAFVGSWMVPGRARGRRRRCRRPDADCARPCRNCRCR